MNWLQALLLGNTPGAGSSEARVALGGLAAAAGLYFTGQPVQAVHLAMVTIAGYTGSRGVAKLGEAVAAAMRQREAAAIVAARESDPQAAVAADKARIEAFSAADAELREAVLRRDAAYAAANAAHAAAMGSR